MSLLTTWGYLIDNDETQLPDMINTTEFDNLTARKYAGDEFEHRKDKVYGDTYDR